MDTTKKYNNPHPRERSNPISVVFFWWMKDLFRIGLSKDLQAEDLYNVLPTDESERLGDQLERNWMEQLSQSEQNDKDQPSLQKAFIKTFSWGFVLPGVLIFLYSIVFKVLQPMYLARVIRYFSPESTSSLNEAYLDALALVVTALMIVLVFNHCSYMMTMLGMRVRIAACSLLYRKVLHLSNASTKNTDTGQVVNLMSNDVARFDYALFPLQFLWIAFIQVPVFIIIIWSEIGPAALLGLGTIVLQSLPMQAYFGKLASKYRLKIAVRTDARVKLMSEIISGIQVIKMYAWEKPFEKMVEMARRVEIDALTKASYLNAVRLALGVSLERVSLFVTLLACVLFDYKITPDKVFALAQLFNSLQLTLCFGVPMAVKNIAELRVTFQRLQSFLVLEEVEGLASAVQENQGITLEEATARWMPLPAPDTLSCVNLRVLQGQLCVVVGPVGAGKSSLLQVILGELPLSSGTLSLGGEPSYCSQDPWLFSGSVRQNILFGQSYQAKRYQEVLHACALESDIDLFVNGDKSIVGERGTFMSGGQRARINLARAVYQNADIYLLDDPLSAVDAHVGKHLFHKCINTFLANKTRILVTHQLQHLEMADHIIIMKNGCIEHQGTFKELQSLDINFTTILAADVIAEKEQEAVEKTLTAEDENKLPSDAEEANESPDAEESEELMAKGQLKNSLYLQYWQAGSSTIGFLLMFALFLVGQMAANSTDYWVTVWVNHEELREQYSHLIIEGDHLQNSSNYLNTISTPWQERPRLISTDKLPTFAEDTTLAYKSSDVEDIIRAAAATQLFTENVDYPKHDSEVNSQTVSSISNNETRGGMFTRQIHVKREIVGNVSDQNITKSFNNKTLNNQAVIQYNETLSVGKNSSKGEEEEILPNVTVQQQNPMTNYSPSSNRQHVEIITEAGISYDNFSTSEEASSSLNTNKQEYQLEDIILEQNETLSVQNASVHQHNESEIYSTNTCIIVYSILVGLAVVLLTLRSLLFTKFCMKSSKGLHDTMFTNLLRTPMKFFTTNPSGRILNRFSKDMGSLDEQMPSSMLECLQVIMVMVGISTLVVLVNYTMIVLVILTLVAFYMGRKVYLATAQDLQRLEATTKSPIFSHVTTSLSGLATIRASNAQEMLRREFDTLQDQHTSVFHLTVTAHASYSFAMDLVNCIITAIVTFSFLLFYNDVRGGDVGLAISQALVLCGLINYCAYLTSMVSRQMTAVERLLQYTNLPAEPNIQSNPDNTPPKSWPSKGSIKFMNLNLNLGVSETVVLRNITLDIQPGHKVGIVGRTGTGKTSLVTTLFRISPFEGSIFIDGVDTESIGLYELRKRISIIPQEPVLFSASLRDNLDPLGEYTDLTLWSALEEVELKHVVSSLDFAVSEDGSNFSVGQRQLICLARAIIRNNKILILDEATANVDPHTDTLIQRTIRLKFKDCTVLTVAHRLNTIMDSDKVLVMETGQIMEYDHPHALLQNSESVFYKLVQEMGSSMANQLKMVAEEAYNSRKEDT